MTGHFPIAALEWVFGLITLAALFAVAYHFRRRPIVAMMAAGERRAAFHRDTLAALETAIAAASAEGRTAEAERLLPHLAGHRRALAGMAAGREFANRR